MAMVIGFPNIETDSALKEYDWKSVSASEYFYLILPCSAL
jgi:hypothetical protein